MVGFAAARQHIWQLFAPVPQAVVLCSSFEQLDWLQQVTIAHLQNAEVCRQSLRAKGTTCSGGALPLAHRGAVVGSRVRSEASLATCALEEEEEEDSGKEVAAGEGGRHVRRSSVLAVVTAQAGGGGAPSSPSGRRRTSRGRCTTGAADVKSSSWCLATRPAASAPPEAGPEPPPPPGDRRVLEVRLGSGPRKEVTVGEEVG
jgi:hypothetical protein